MEGREVFKHAVGMITDVIVDALQDATGNTADDIDWFVPHQANLRIIDASAPTSSASARPEGGARPSTGTATPRRRRSRSPLSVAVADGRIKRGDLVLLEAMGGGFTWGSVLLRW